MHKAYRVAIADDNPIDLARLQECVLHAGHRVVLEDRTGGEFFRICLTVSPDLIITDVPTSEMDRTEMEQTALTNHTIPIIIVSDVDIEYVLDHVAAYRTMAFLTKPVRENELRAAIAVGMQRFEELQSSRAEAFSTRQALEDRKLIERAKGIVMREHSLDEAAAFKCLQNLARSRRQKLSDVARCIILADQALDACVDRRLA